ncbi:MAG: type II secretion system F family protein [Deltaproteobacteria bacterium]|nr:type II secretion system F family protein [Deltaproteobacteria bacterium]
MPVFAYEGRTASGKVLRGNMEAPSREAVINRLRAQRIQPNTNRIRERGKGLDRDVSIPGFRKTVKSKDVVVFTRQLTTMIDAGMPLVQILEILASQSDNKTFGAQVREVKESVEAGSTLSDALRKFPKTFDELYVNMVQAGEVGGILDTILGRLSIYMEKMMSLKRKIKGAMIYPATIITVAVVVTLILLVFVIPVFAELFASFDKALPLPTQIVINISNFVISTLHWIGLTAVLIVVAIRQTYRTERGRLAIDRLLLRLPIIGDLIRKASIARFARTLGTLVSSGVPILDSLTITARTAGNKVVERAGFMIRESISQGRTMLEPLSQSGVFPPMVCQMIGAGEMTGAIDQMLQKIADFYEEEVDVAVNNLTALMEPLVIVVLGTIIGGLVVSMYLPIFQLGSLLGS